MFPNMSHIPNMSQFHNMQNNRSQKPVDSTRLYKLLNIDKTSTDKQIKKAYILKSMNGEYRHPDRGGDTAKFQQLKQAYDILKDKQKRKLYDKYGEDSLKSNFQEPMNINNLFGVQQRNRQQPQIQKEKPQFHKLIVSLEDLCKGITKKMKINRRVIINTTTNKICDPLNTSELCNFCQQCKGRGRINLTRQIGPGMIQQLQTKCQQCNGIGKELKSQFKIIQQSEIIELFIEKGSEAGDKIKIEEKGNMSPGKLSSDIIFIIEEKKHTIFQRKGNDLLIKKKINLMDALCGFEFIIQHPDNRFIVVKSDSIIKEKSLKCVDNSGMPLKNDNYSYGKLFILFQVIYPTQEEITPELKNIIKKLFIHIKSYRSLLNLPIEQQLSKLPKESEIDYETLHEIDPKLFGKKNNHKSANDSDSDEDDQQVQKCRTM